MGSEIRTSGRRGVAVIVLGASTGAVAGALVCAFALGLPGLAWAVVAGVVGTAFGGYTGAILGGLVAGD